MLQGKSPLATRRWSSGRWRAAPNANTVLRAVPVRSAGETAYRIREFRLRFFAASTIFQPSPEASPAFVQGIGTWSRWREMLAWLRASRRLPDLAMIPSPPRLLMNHGFSVALRRRCLRHQPEAPVQFDMIWPLP